MNTHESPAAYQDRLREQLHRWEEEIEKLQMQLEAASPHTHIDRQKLMWHVRDKHEAAKDRLSTLEAAENEVFHEVQKGTEEAWKELGDSLKQAREAFSRHEER